MRCELFKYSIETATHWIGNTGNEYPKEQYSNHGYRGLKNGLKDLPKNEYPYTIKYKKELMFKCCEQCSCEKII